MASDHGAYDPVEIGIERIDENRGFITARIGDEGPIVSIPKSQVLRDGHGTAKPWVEVPGWLADSLSAIRATREGGHTDLDTMAEAEAVHGEGKYLRHLPAYCAMDIDGVKGETEKALRIKLKDGVAVWVPKSQVYEVDDDVCVIPTWLVDKLTIRDEM